MRKISLLPIVLFEGIILFTLIISYGVYVYMHSPTMSVVIFLLLNILFYRLCAHTYLPRNEAYTEKDDLLAYDIQTLYDILFVVMLLTSRIFPYPIHRLLYKIFGLKIGKNSYPGLSIISHPYHFVTVGDDVMFGMHASITPHTYESGGKLTIKEIRIGNNVTIGTNAVVFPGVIIEDNAIVAAGAVVTKNTHIGNGEVWAGIPARKIRDGV